MWLLLVLLCNISQATLYFLDSNVHIRVFSNKETTDKWDLIWYEYGHLSALSFGVNKKIWSFGTFNFENYQVLSLDVACSFEKAGCQTVPEDEPHSPNTDLSADLLAETYKEVRAVEVTSTHIFLSWHQDKEDQWVVSKLSEKSGDTDQKPIIPVSGDPVLGLTMDNSTVYWFTDQGDIFYGKIQGKSGKIRTTLDNKAPRQIFWRDDYLWILYGNGTTISHIDLKAFFQDDIVKEVAHIDIPEPNFHIPSMTITKDALYYLVEEFAPNMTNANWTMHSYFFNGTRAANRMPDSITALSGKSGTPYLNPLSTFITDSDSVMTTVHTPNVNGEPDYFSRGLSIFVGIVSFVSVVTLLVFYVAVCGMRN